MFGYILFIGNKVTCIPKGAALLFGILQQNLLFWGCNAAATGHKPLLPFGCKNFFLSSCFL